MNAARTASLAIMEENAAANPSYRKVYEAWDTFRADSFRWFSTAEKTYQDFAFG
jgi:TRAP-type mannitol/chloroaromatic compound transport system substrate-binding protein